MALGWKSSYFRYKQLFLNVSVAYKKRADLRAFLEIVLSIIAVLIFILFAIKPTVLTIISLVQQIKESQKVLAGLNQKVSDLQKASTLLAQNQQFLLDINIAIASVPSPDIFLKQIHGLSAKDSVTVTSVSMDDIILMGDMKPKSVSKNVEPLPENANEIGYTISIKGAYANVSSFITDLENLRVISAIDNINLSATTTDTGKVMVAVISGRIPYLITTLQQ